MVRSGCNLLTWVVSSLSANMPLTIITRMGLVSWLSGPPGHRDGPRALLLPIQGHLQYRGLPGAGPSLLHTGKQQRLGLHRGRGWPHPLLAAGLNEGNANHLLQWWALRPAAHLALPDQGLWSYNTPMAQVLQDQQGSDVRGWGRRCPRPIWGGWQDHIHPEEWQSLHGHQHLQTHGTTCKGDKSFPACKYKDDLARHIIGSDNALSPTMHGPLPPYGAFYSLLYSANMLEEGQGPGELCWASLGLCTRGHGPASWPAHLLQ